MPASLELNSGFFLDITPIFETISVYLCILLESCEFIGFKMQISATRTPQITVYFSKTQSTNAIKVIALCVFAIIAITFLVAILTSLQLPKSTTTPSGATKRLEEPPIIKDKAFIDSSIVENSTPLPSPDAQTEDVHQQYHDLADAIAYKAPDSILESLINRGDKPCNLYNGNTLSKAIYAKAGYSTIKLLIDNGAEPSNVMGDTLNEAISRHAPIEILQLLFNNGAVIHNGCSIYDNPSFHLVDWLS